MWGADFFQEGFEAAEVLFDFLVGPDLGEVEGGLAEAFF